MPTNSRSITVALGERSYPIWIGPGLVDDGDLLAGFLGPGAVVVVTSAAVAPLYLERLRTALGERLALVQVLPDGEQHKTLQTVAGLYDALAAAKIGRDGTLIALGGGVVGDITGFTAATWHRGVDYIQVPTTLLAQVDSSVGGKTGVNHPSGKNLIGAFHQPKCVLADVETLSTLPQRELCAGLAEVVKYGLIGDPDFFAWTAAHAAALRAGDGALLVEAVRRSCTNKARVVAADEREGGTRALLNLGHTFGHALETLAGYGHLLHGEAVAIGMVLAAELSCRMGWLERAEVHALQELLLALGLPACVPPGITPDAVLAAMHGDKKSSRGRLRLVLLRGVGDAVLSGDFLTALLDEVLQDACGSGVNKR